MSIDVSHSDCTHLNTLHSILISQTLSTYLQMNNVCHDQDLHSSLHRTCWEYFCYVSVLDYTNVHKRDSWCSQRFSRGLGQCRRRSDPISNGYCVGKFTSSSRQDYIYFSVHISIYLLTNLLSL